MVAKLGGRRQHIPSIWVAFLGALFALADVCLQPALAAQVLLTAAEPENDSKEEGKAKEGEQSADKEACARHRPHHVHRRHPLDEAALAVQIQALPAFTRLCRPDGEHDPFGNGIGTRLRC
jgi:hypothetical protein